MDEKIYTIPVTTAFEQSDQCPFCLLYKQLEENEISLITGASMMEPDIRIRTNEQGFCRKHYDMMHDNKTRLPLALTLQSHLAALLSDLKPGGFLTRDAGAKPAERIRKLEDSCYVCGRIEQHFPKMFDTACMLYSREKEFREHFSAQKYFCLPHYGRLLEAAKRSLPKNAYGDFVKSADEIVRGYLTSLYDDISLFCKKFDYNYRDEPWGNAKDSVERSMDFLTSTK